MNDKKSINESENKESPTNEDYEIVQGSYVEVEYTGTFKDGTEFDSSVGKEPLAILAGQGMLIKGFDEALMGMRVGEEKEVDIIPKDGYGERNEQLVQTVSRNSISGVEPKIGMMLGVRAPTGQTFPAIITKISDEEIELDANHPLAGKDLHFKIKIIAARKPTKEDMAKFAPEPSACATCTSSDCSTCGL